MKNITSSVQEAIALRRMRLVQQIIDFVYQHWPLSVALEEVAASQPLPGNDEAPPQFVAKRTLEDWYYAFKKGGFEGLKPKQRCDRGKPRRLSAQQQQWILEQVRCFPGVPVKLLYRQWKQTDPSLPALSAVYRWLEQNDLDAHGRRYLLRQNIPGPTKTFEAPGVNDLWIVDNNTDRVYQYSNAVGRTSGSLAASTSFALAAGNANPQGIADGAAKLGSDPGASVVQVQYS